MTRMKLLAVAIGVLWSGSSFADILKTIQVGATDQTVTVKVIDASTGVPSTDLTFESSGIDLEYWRHGANAAVEITEATQTANGAHSDGGFVHVGAGVYRLDLPDAAVASGATAVDVYGVITGEIVLGGTVQLVAYNPQDSVRLGLTALPNAAADAAGGLPISDAGGLNMDGLATLQALGVNVTTGTFSSQTQFTLAAGSADDDAYNNWGALIIDQSTSAQRAFGIVDAYVGGTKQVTLRADPGVFTMATGDTVVLMPASLIDGLNFATVEGTDATDYFDALVSGLSTFDASTDTVLLANPTQIHVGTAEGGSTTTLEDTTLAALFPEAEALEGRLLCASSGNINGQCALITDWDVGNDLLTLGATFTDAWVGQEYQVHPAVVFTP